jgi:ribosomal protein S27E
LRHHMTTRRRAENEPFAPETPEASTFVYCVGCGAPLGQRTGLLRGRGAAITTYCTDCQGRDDNVFGEAAPATHCFRCGTLHIRYVEEEPYRTIHSICPRCRPERAARYAAGDFAPLPPSEEPEAETVSSAGAEVVESIVAQQSGESGPTLEAASAPTEEPAPKPSKRGRKPKAEA